MISVNLSTKWNLSSTENEIFFNHISILLFLMPHVPFIYIYNEKKELAR